MDKLPAPALVKIFDELNIKNLCQVSYSCRRLHKYANMNIIWKNRLITDYEDYSYIHKNVNNYKNLYRRLYEGRACIHTIENMSNKDKILVKLSPNLVRGDIVIVKKSGNKKYIYDGLKLRDFSKGFLDKALFNEFSVIFEYPLHFWTDRVLPLSINFTNFLDLNDVQLEITQGYFWFIDFRHESTTYKIIGSTGHFYDKNKFFDFISKCSYFYKLVDTTLFDPLTTLVAIPKL